MREKPMRLFAEHVGELIFDGVHVVASSLDIGYPEIKRIASDSVSMYSVHTSDICVGSSELVLEGYLLGEDMVRSGAYVPPDIASPPAPAADAVFSSTLVPFAANAGSVVDTISAVNAGSAVDTTSAANAGSVTGMASATNAEAVTGTTSAMNAAVVTDTTPGALPGTPAASSSPAVTTPNVIALPDPTAPVAGTALRRGAARRRADSTRLDGMKALLLSLCAPGQEFVLEVGSRRRALYAAELTFSSEGPFGTGLAEKFRLRAFSDNAFFHSGEVVFGAQAQTQLEMQLPVSPRFSTALRKGVCDITVQNDGDEVCGFVLEAVFPSDTLHFALSSNRGGKNLHVLAPISAGESIIISTVPGNRYIRKASGKDLISCVSGDYEFPMLAPGKSVLTFNSFTSVPPTVQGRFTPGYLIP